MREHVFRLRVRAAEGRTADACNQLLASRGLTTRVWQDEADATHFNVDVRCQAASFEQAVVEARAALGSVFGEIEGPAMRALAVEELPDEDLAAIRRSE